jgi:hypothetical protein
MSSLAIGVDVAYGRQGFTALVVLSGHTLAHRRVWRGPAPSQDIAAECADLCERFGPEAIANAAAAVEAAYVAANVDTALGLARQTGRWTALLECLGVGTVLTPTAQQWRVMLPGGRKRLKRADEKARAAHTVEHLLGIPGLTEHEQEAACMALWARREADLAARTAKAGGRR